MSHDRAQLNTWLPLPEHFTETMVDQVWRVPYQQRAADARGWAAEFGIRPASEDNFRLALVLIDVQNTFCISDFELFVAGRSGRGAVEDNIRLSRFIYHNLATVTHITATMDTHRAVQIFHPIFLVDRHGNHPEPHTQVALQDILEGRWQFNSAIAKAIQLSAEQGQQHLLHYTRTLIDQGKYDLTIWPYHAMLGGIGHALVSSIEEALFFHSIARSTQPGIVIKGEAPLTEFYSAIGPEVESGARGEQLAAPNPAILEIVKESDAVVIAGQAKSHCVAWTVSDLLDEIQHSDPGLAGKVYLLEDCTSPVVVPGVVDYSDQADAAFARFAEAGMRRVSSSDLMAEWPVFRQISEETHKPVNAK